MCGRTPPHTNIHPSTHTYHSPPPLSITHLPTQTHTPTHTRTRTHTYTTTQHTRSIAQQEAGQTAHDPGLVANWLFPTNTFFASQVYADYTQHAQRHTPNMLNVIHPTCSTSSDDFIGYTKTAYVQCTCDTILGRTTLFASQVYADYTQHAQCHLTTSSGIPKPQTFSAFVTPYLAGQLNLLARPMLTTPNTLNVI